jgi:hypothetical protein
MDNGSEIKLGGNTLVADEFQFIGKNTIDGVMGFKDTTLNFTIAESVGRFETVLGVNGAVTLDATKIKIDIDNKNMRAGYTVDLIKGVSITDLGFEIWGLDDSGKEGWITWEEGKKGKAKGKLGEFDFTLNLTDDNRLVVTFEGGKLDARTKSLSEGNMASLAFVNQGGNLIAGAGINNAVRSAVHGRGQPYNVAWFSAVSGGQSRYTTGSYVDVTGLSFLAGFAGRFTRRATAGIFVEYGIGKYGAYNDTSDGVVEAEGDTNYLGVGMLGHYRFGRGLYAEGSVRAGSINNVYKSENLMDTPESFDTSASYYGGHVGLGYIARLRRVYSNLDSSVKYFATMQKGHEANLTEGGVSIAFDDILSQKVRVGSRLTIGTSVRRPYTVPTAGLILNKFTIADAVIRPYVGLAAEYDFGTTANAIMYDTLSVAAPSIGGATGVGEAGFVIDDEDFSVSLGGEGYMGVRQGFGANLQFKYRFEL